MAVSDGPSPELAELFDRLLSQAEECDRFAAEHPEPEVRQLFKDQAADIRGQVRREFEREAILQSLRDGDLGPWRPQPPWRCSSSVSLNRSVTNTSSWRRGWGWVGGDPSVPPRMVTYMHFFLALGYLVFDTGTDRATGASD